MKVWILKRKRTGSYLKHTNSNMYVFGGYNTYYMFSPKQLKPRFTRDEENSLFFYTKKEAEEGLRKQKRFFEKRINKCKTIRAKCKRFNGYLQKINWSKCTDDRVDDFIYEFYNISGLDFDEYYVKKHKRINKKDIDREVEKYETILPSYEELLKEYDTVEAIKIDYVFKKPETHYPQWEKPEECFEIPDEPVYCDQCGYYIPKVKYLNVGVDLCCLCTDKLFKEHKKNIKRINKNVIKSLEDQIFMDSI